MGYTQTAQLVSHFIIAQLMGIIMFYVGLRSYLVLNANWTVTHLFIANNEASGKVDWRTTATSLGQLLDCVLENSYSLILSFSDNFGPACMGPVGTASMYGLGWMYNVFMSFLNCLGLLLVVLFISVLVFELMKSGASNIGEGRYLAFSYNVQKNRTFRVLSWTLVIFIVALFCDTCRMMVYLYQMGYTGYLINFLEFLLPTLLTLGYSAYSLGSSDAEPFFDYEADEFQNLQFSRGWSAIMEDNNTFALKLGVALLKQKRGSEKPVKEMLADWMVPACSTVAEVVAACDKPTEKDSLT